MPAPEKITKG
jgi:hypothetical protein